jgi:chromosome partitioning protein
VAEKIAVLSQKGGTGKTTAVRHLADAFRRAGLSVLAVDLDPQGNLSGYFDVPPDASPTIGEVLAGQAKAREAVHDGVIPSSLHLASVESSLTGKIGRELTLRKALKPIDGDWDVILMDCPPNLGLLAVCGLVAADHALLSAQAQHFALEGVAQALEVVELVRDGLNGDLSLLGIAFTIADLRTVHSREAVASLREERPGDVLDTVVRQSIAYAESAERATSILDHRPDLGGDYVLLADELLGRLGLAAARRRLKPLVKDAQARAAASAA